MRLRFVRSEIAISLYNFDCERYYDFLYDRIFFLSISDIGILLVYMVSVILIECA